MTRVLVSDDGFCDALGLRDGGVQRFGEQVEGEIAAVEFEGEEGSGEVFVCGADVVEKAGEEVSLVGDGERVRGGEVDLHCSPWRRHVVLDW